MIERLLLDRIDLPRQRPAINQAAQFPFDVDPRAAQAPLSGLDRAGPRTEKTFDRCFHAVRMILPVGDVVPGNVAFQAIDARGRRGNPIAGFRRTAHKILDLLEGRGIFASEQKRLPGARRPHETRARKRSKLRGGSQ